MAFSINLTFLYVIIKYINKFGELKLKDVMILKEKKNILMMIIKKGICLLN